MADENQDIAPPAPAEDEGINVYHSSPHKFDRFDMSKIGTGEGNQAFGYGLYAAESPKVSGQGGEYWRTFIDKMKAGPERTASFALMASKWNREEAIKRLEKNAEYHEDKAIPGKWANGPDFEEGSRLLAQESRQAIEMLKSGESIAPHTYDVTIKAHSDHFLDWDKPLSDQSEFVKNALNDFVEREKSYMERYPNSPMGNPFGSNIYESNFLVPGKYRDKRAASKALLDRGIVGIKYLDAGSRDKGVGTHNYVVFDDKLLDIKRRYEMGGAVPMASGGEAGDTQSMPQLTSEQQSLLDQLSRAIDRVYPAMDAAEARQPVIRHEPTMPGEPALTTEQHQEYNIGQLQNALARIPTDYPTGPVGYAEGGSLRKGISDWKWKPLSRVRESIGVSEIPSHVQDFGKFMDETANKASGEGLSVRDLIKAYTITRSSIRRAARKADTVRNAGLNIPDSITGMVRPEGAFGHWLHTSYGQNYLNDAEKGRVNEDAIKDAVRIMRPFGGQNQLVDALTWAVNNLPGQEKKFSELVSRAQQMQSSPSEWRELVKPIKGIRESKAGFMASMIGRGDQPTLDARQIVLHTGRPSDEASKYLSRSGAGASAVDRLARRQKALDLTIPQNLSPYYQHLAHHTIWDKVGNETTTHQDVIDAMRGAASGGAISSSILSHPVASAMRALGFKGIDGEESNLKKNESGVVSRALMLTSKKA